MEAENTKIDKQTVSSENQEWTLSDAAGRLLDIYKSDEYLQLLKKRSRTTYLEAMHKQRSETIFSSLIAWILENPDFNKPEVESPIMYLLRLLAHKAYSAEKLMDKDLRNKILINDIDINNVSAQTEVPIGGKRRVDVVVTCDVTCKSDNAQSSNPKKIRIILENKVDSQEHSKQCKVYHDHFENQTDEYTNIYVYLSIEEPKTLSDGSFITITYQELLDYVLITILMQGEMFSEKSRNYLQDFIDTITSINNNPQIAMDQETQQLLKDFYEKNKDLIRMAVLEGSDDQDLKDATKESQDREYEKFDITYNGKTVSAVSRAKIATVAIDMLGKDGWAPDKIKETLDGVVWMIPAGGNRPSGYDAEVKFPNGDVYLVHTHRYGKELGKKLVEVLENMGFKITKIS